MNLLKDLIRIDLVENTGLIGMTNELFCMYVDKIFKEKEILKMNVTIPKVMISFKFNIKEIDYVDDIWKHDFGLVATAVSNRGMALRYAAPELQDCEEIVRLAVDNDGYAIRSASERLRDHYDLAVRAITTYTDAYLYLSPRLQADPEIKRIYSLKKEEENKWLPSKMR